MIGFGNDLHAFVSGGHRFWFEIIKINALHRFFDVQVSWSSVQAKSSPIVYPISCIRILLDFED